MPPMIQRTFSKDVKDGIMPAAIEPLHPSEAWSPPASIQGNLRERRIYVGLGNDLGTVDIPFFRSSGGSLGWEYVKTPAGKLLMRGSWNMALYGELDRIHEDLKNIPDYPPDVARVEESRVSREEEEDDVQEPSLKRRKTDTGSDGTAAPIHKTPKIAKAFVVHKNRLSGLWGQTTPLEELLHSRGIKTLLFSGVNTDQYVIFGHSCAAQDNPGTAAPVPGHPRIVCSSRSCFSVISMHTAFSRRVLFAPRFSFISHFHPFLFCLDACQAR